MDAFNYRGGELFAEGVALSAIADRFGTPTYVYSRAHIEAQYLAYADALAGIEAWREEAALPNLPPSIPLQAVVGAGLQPAPALPKEADDVEGFDVVYTANTLHIMGWPQVQALFAALPAITRADALLAVYGPFNVGGQYTSDSNRAFDQWLHETYAEGGLRDLEAVQALAGDVGFVQIAAFAMPANNQLLLWRRGGLRAGR